MWLERAACQDHDPEWFFRAVQEPVALAICAGCPVIAECRQANDKWEAAVTPTYWYGVFGNETASQRRARRRAAMQAALDAQSGSEDGGAEVSGA